jgi:hypothetical protein
VVDDVTLGDAISRFAAETTKKLSALSARGEPEDQIRAPLTTLVDDLADICRVGRRNVVTIASRQSPTSRPGLTSQCSATAPWSATSR